MVILLIALAAALLALLAEWLHARRTVRIARLAFGPAARPRAWVAAVPIARSASAALLCWGLLTLYSIDGAATSNPKGEQPLQHLVIALDVSPSMYLKDAGPGGGQKREERARELLRSVFQRLDMNRTRVSVVAFYTAAKPVVVDTVDLNVVDNIIGDLPLEHAFKEGATNMYAGVREAAKLAERWTAGTATLLVVSDGDTLPDAIPPRLPIAIADTLILGVGSPYRGSQIAGRSSRQDAASLRQLAARLNGVYHDGNEKHLPTDILTSLSMLDARQDEAPTRRALALIASALGAVILALIGPVLTLAGAPHYIHQRPTSNTPSSSRSGRLHRRPADVPPSQEAVLVP